MPAPVFFPNISTITSTTTTSSSTIGEFTHPMHLHGPDRVIQQDPHPSDRLPPPDMHRELVDRVVMAIANMREGVRYEDTEIESISNQVRPLELIQAIDTSRRM